MNTINEQRTITEEMRLSELHRLYRYMLKHDAEITLVQNPEPNVFHITLGWWQFENLPEELQGHKGDYKFWASHKIILHPQVCKLQDEVVLKLGWKV